MIKQADEDFEGFRTLFFSLWKKASKKRDYDRDKWMRLENAILSVIKPSQIKKIPLMTYDERKQLKLETCRSGSDGDCSWEHCPQNRDGEPDKTGRHCPFDWDRDEDYQ